MNKLLKKIVVITVIACMAIIPSLAFGAETGITETNDTTKSDQMAYRLKASRFPKSGVVINSDDEFERIRMGHQEIGIGVVKTGDDKDNLQDIIQFNYTFTIDGVNYPKVVTVDVENNFFNLNLPYGVAGKAKLEVENKSDKAAKGVLEFEIDNGDFYGIGPEPSALIPYRLEKCNNILSAEQQKLAFSYNRETGEYTITLPENPLKDSQKKFFEGWKVTVGENAGKVYEPADKVVVDEKCVIEPVTDGSAGHWGEKYNRWVFYDANGDLVKNAMRTINGNNYYFDQYGIMATGWLDFDGSWYYFNEKGEGTEGAMAINQWKKIDGKWYYFHEDGKMASDENVGEYYVNKSGAWSYDHWVKSDNGKWWYAYGKGGYAKNAIITIDGKQYFFDEKGWMVTGWKYDNGSWYYLNKKGEGTEGAMTLNTWKKIGKNWYYFYEDGKMAADTMVGDYYVNKSGAWRWNHWVKTDAGKYWYYFKEGGYPSNVITTINGNRYYFNKDGWMVTGWKCDNGIWYYFNKSGQGIEGAMVHNQWKKIAGKWYYFDNEGKMAKNTVIDGYKVDNTGAWVN